MFLLHINQYHRNKIHPISASLPIAMLTGIRKAFARIFRVGESHLFGVEAVIELKKTGIQLKLITAKDMAAHVRSSKIRNLTGFPLIVM